MVAANSKITPYQSAIDAIAALEAMYSAIENPTEAQRQQHAEARQAMDAADSGNPDIGFYSETNTESTDPSVVFDNTTFGTQILPPDPAFNAPNKTSSSSSTTGPSTTDTVSLSGGSAVQKQTYANADAAIFALDGLYDSIQDPTGTDRQTYAEKKQAIVSAAATVTGDNVMGFTSQVTGNARTPSEALQNTTFTPVPPASGGSTGAGSPATQRVDYADAEEAIAALDYLYDSIQDPGLTEVNTHNQKRQQILSASQASTADAVISFYSEVVGPTDTPEHELQNTVFTANPPPSPDSAFTKPKFVDNANAATGDPTDVIKIVDGRVVAVVTATTAPAASTSGIDSTIGSTHPDTVTIVTTSPPIGSSTVETVIGSTHPDTVPTLNFQYSSDTLVNGLHVVLKS